MDYLLIVYFLAGILQDFLATLNMRYVAEKKTAAAAVSSFLITIVSMIVLYNIISQLNPRESIVSIIVFASGIATGTLLGMRFKIPSKQNRAPN